MQRRGVVWSMMVVGYLFQQIPTVHAAAALDDDIRDQEKPITVRVWNDAGHGGVHVGHISIDTGTRYISLWPSSEDRAEGDLHMAQGFGASLIKHIAQKKVGGCVIAAKATGMPLMGDLVAEDRAPEQVYQLRLNARSMDAYWDHLCVNADKRPMQSVGEPEYAAQVVKFNDLTWYVGGDPRKHKMVGQSDTYLEERLNVGRHYSCASMVLHMLVAGEISRYGKIDDKTLSDLVPAAEQEWYRHVLSRPKAEDLLAEEQGPMQESAFSDAMGRMAAWFLRPLVEKVMTADYVSPWQVGELVRRCCVNQYYDLLAIPPQLGEGSVAAFKKHLSKVLTNHYPEKGLLNKYQRQFEKLLELDSDDFNEEQKAVLSSYMLARGRTLKELVALLEIELARVSAPKVGKKAGASKLPTKKAESQKGGCVLL